MIPRFIPRLAVRRLGRLAAPLLAALLLAVPAIAGETAPTLNARRDLFDDRYVVAADQTYTETLTSEITLLTPRGIAQHDRARVTFYPKSQKLEVLEAWVVQPDGTRVEVGPEGRFTRPSAASQNAPGFTGSLTTTVVFPRLQPGSRTHVVWRRTQITPPTLGFAAWSIASLEDASVVDRLSIEAPAGLPLHWGARGGVRTTDTTKGALRHITAEMPPQPGARPSPPPSTPPTSSRCSWPPPSPAWRPSAPATPRFPPGAPSPPRRFPRSPRASSAPAPARTPPAPSTTG